MTAVVLVALLTLAAGAAEAALPAPPFRLTLSSASPAEGQPVTVRVEGTRDGRDGQRHDLYVVLASAEEAAFLTPDGAWAPRPVPYAASVSPSEPPIVRQWPRAWPPGRHALGMVVVAPSADPLDRSQWRYRPVIRWIDIAPARPDATPPATGTLALLGVATAVAAGLVWWAGVSASGP
jgi:hypothetical protein